MTPTSVNKGGVRYRYYTSCVMHEGRRDEAGSVARVPAPEIEAVVLKALGADQLSIAANEHQNKLLQSLERVIVKRDVLEIYHSVAGQPAVAIVVPWSPPVRARRMVVMDDAEGSLAHPIRAETRA